MISEKVGLSESVKLTRCRSGTGLRPGFENIVRPDTKDGRKLAEAGFTW